MTDLELTEDIPTLRSQARDLREAVATARRRPRVDDETKAFYERHWPGMAASVARAQAITESQLSEVEEQLRHCLIQEQFLAESGAAGAAGVHLDDLTLRLMEAAAGTLFEADGTCRMVVIRPSNGRGPGNHIYEAPMLEVNASKLSGLPMYMGHDTPAKQRERGVQPRPPSELVGRITESWWDPTFTSAEDTVRNYGPGAVIGRVKFIPKVRELVEAIPEVVKGSLNARATGVKRGTRAGKPGWIVEGIEADPETASFDLVTASGAGGRVMAILEAATEGPQRIAGRSADATRARARLDEANAALGLNPQLYGGTPPAPNDFNAVVDELGLNPRYYTGPHA